jgi:hypothetical protein
MMPAMMMVTCPCCRGRKRLLVEDAETGITAPVICCHCQGEGEIEAEAGIVGSKHDDR